MIRYGPPGAQEQPEAVRSRTAAARRTHQEQPEENGSKQEEPEADTSRQERASSSQEEQGTTMSHISFWSPARLDIESDGVSCRTASAGKSRQSGEFLELRVLRHRADDRFAREVTPSSGR